MQHDSGRHPTHVRAAIIAVLAVALIAAGLVVAGVWWRTSERAATPSDSSSAISTSSAMHRSKASATPSSPGPDAATDTPEAKAAKTVNAMPLEDQVGQLVMTPLSAGSDPSSLRDLIANQHVGSVLIIGNWNIGTSGVRQAPTPCRRTRPSAISSSWRPIRKAGKCSMCVAWVSMPCLPASSKAS
jgi:beta-N-acetylhexosaminidase